MYTNILPDAEILRERFTYNKETGELRWAKGQNLGKIAGYLYTSYYRKFKHKKVPVKYWYVKLNGKKIYAHRIIWKLVTGQDLGKLCIDHINGDGTDNRWNNLRKADGSQNAANREASYKSISGIKGVRRMSNKVKGFTYRADISVEGESISLGTYPTLEEAVRARAKAERQFFGEFANPSIIEDYKLQK